MAHKLQTLLDTRNCEANTWRKIQGRSERKNNHSRTKKWVKIEWKRTAETTQCAYDCDILHKYEYRCNKVAMMMRTGGNE